MFIYPKNYDVLVVGGGHAGIEAALAAARIGCETLLLTTNPDTIGQMSCNPAIGGLAKGHLAREIDALGGEMGKCTDMSGIHFRLLNTRKGPAVQAPRAQCDKRVYQLRMKHACELQQRLEIKLGSISAIFSECGRCRGVDTDMGVRFLARTVIITTGTFLRGLMHVGPSQKAGGRAGEASAIGLTKSLQDLGLMIGRLKTGTPPRLHRRSINFSKTELQPSDSPIPWFSYWKDDLFHVEHNERRPQEYPENSALRVFGPQSCYITRTTDATTKLIRASIHLSPMYSGLIEGVGPRYCPSIEDKIVRFSEKPTHQVFLEPEGIHTEEIYVNGFSTCLPFEIQHALVRTIVGCENAEIIRPAYAVEYDFVFPTQLSQCLETKVCENLFLAGQINGTSGYEEAAAQGIMAGINAARRVQSLPGIVLRRDQAYIGVLIDDLVSKGTSEPYRMFTSRAEYRLLLRHDNADIRLSPLGHDMGLLNKRQLDVITLKINQINNEVSRLDAVRHEGQKLSQLLRRPEIQYQDLPSKDQTLSDEVVQQVEIAVKYAGYIDRQQVEAMNLKSSEAKRIPAGFDYTAVNGLRSEAKQKLQAICPANLGQAARISGVSPSDISVLMVWLRNAPERNKSAANGV